jgi:hypothetical protein
VKLRQDCVLKWTGDAAARYAGGMNTPSPTNTSRFYADEYVFSRIHGHGRVLMSGANPVIRFLNGLNMRVAGATLRVTSAERYHEVVSNLIFAEEWSHLRAYRRPLAADWSEMRGPNPRPLIERMQEAEMRPAIPDLLAPVRGGVGDDVDSMWTEGSSVRFP